MYPASLGALSLLLLLSGAGADMQTAPVDFAPQLQLSRLSGRLEISRDKRKNEAAGRKLPLLLSGSRVRVLSGSASFDSDYHVTVRAGEGVEFEFTSVPPEGSRSGTLRIAAGPSGFKAVDVSVGDKKFRLRNGAALAITSAWPGELSVRGEGYGVQHAPGSLNKDGTIQGGLRRMAPGEAVDVAVPEVVAFDNPAVDAARLKITDSRGDAVLVAAEKDASPSMRRREEEARRVISAWPVVAQRTAEVVLETYGPPDLSVSDRLVWYDNGAWKITTVYRDPREHLDVLEQTVGYRVPQEKVPALAKLDLALRISRDNRSLSAVSESEETNILALNLADEVVREKRSPEEARAFYLKTVVQWNAGKSSAYMKELLFR